MPQEILRQVSFNGGELDPRMTARRDVKAYYTELSIAENVNTSPLGPVARRPGTRFVDYCRHQLEEIAVTAEMIVTANGGTPADAVAADGELFQTEQDLGALDHIILTVDFGEMTRVGLIDVIDYSVAPEADPAATPPPFVYPWPGAGPGGPYDPGPVGGDLP